MPMRHGTHCLKLKQELHNVHVMNINDHSMKLQKLVHSLASNDAPMEDDDLVFVTLNVFAY